MGVVESEGAVGVVEVAEALARRPVLVLRRVREVLRVPVPGELRGNGEREKECLEAILQWRPRHIETPVNQYRARLKGGPKVA